MGENVSASGNRNFVFSSSETEKVHLQSNKYISPNQSGVDNQLLSEGSKPPSTELGRRQLDTERQHIRKIKKKEVTITLKKSDREKTAKRLASKICRIVEEGSGKNEASKEGKIEKKKDVQQESNVKKSRHNKKSVLMISYKFVPEIIEAIKSGIFTKKFINLLCDHLSSIGADDNFLSKFSKQFQRLAVSKHVLQEFNSHVQNYFEQIKNCSSSKERQQIEHRLKQFVYNAFAFPYQRLKEGSCFSTAVLISFWENDPIGYMQFMRTIIDNNRIDWSGFEGTDVSSYGKWDKNVDAIYQKVVSGIALSTTTFLKKTEKRLKKKVKNQCENFGLPSRNSDKFIQALFDKGLQFDHGRWYFSILLSQKATETQEDMIGKVIELAAEYFPQEEFSQQIRKLAEYICASNELNPKGGKPIEILDRVDNGYEHEKREIIIKHPVTDCQFSIEQFHPVLEVLERETRGQFLVATYRKMKGGHAFTIKADKYDVQGMKIGEIVAFGHLNRDETVQRNQTIFLKKISDNMVQLVRKDGRPITDEKIVKFGIYERIPKQKNT